MFILGGLWCLHYGYRAFVFPFRMRSNGKRKPCLTVVLAFIFNVANGTTNAFAITELAPHLSVPSMHFFVGLVVFFVGFAINQQSDSILLSLREPNETGYKIPFGGFYRWVSAPNYLGELIEWLGFAIAACTFPALIFACFTGANLIPRALSHHRWYVENFADYPSNRKAIVPFVL